MDNVARKALEGSIKKWEKIVAGRGFDHAYANCPLCTLFNNDSCEGCPVKKRTGEDYCGGTPYQDFCKHATIDQRWEIPRKARAKTVRAKAAAKRMLKFLVSLRPKQ